MLTFLHISDTHISSDTEYHPDWVHPSTPHPNVGIELLATRIAQLPYGIDFILHTGDVCANPVEADYLRAREWLVRFQQPIYLLPGNHDSADLMASILHDGRHIFVLQDDHIRLNGYHLITLNSSGAVDGHAPTLFDGQIRWLETELKQTADAPLIVALHHPLIETGVDWIDYNMRVQNGITIHQHLAQYTAQLCGVFHGHLHQSINSFCDGVLYASAPSTWFNLEAYPGLKADELDTRMQCGFNLVIIRNNHAFIRRCSI